MTIQELVARLRDGRSLNLNGNAVELPKAWPAGILDLFLDDNTAELLPTEWPVGIKYLSLRRNRAALPKEWPMGVEKLFLSGNTAELPEEWPMGIKVVNRC